jgi:hypothetical protein
MRKICCGLTLLLCGSSLYAAEGFWLARQLDTDSTLLSELQRPGAQAISALPLQQATAATARIADCSGAFVSANGLFLTSAHCITQYLLQHSTGFAADTQAQEYPLGDLQLDLLQQSDDVTIAVHRQLSAETSELARAAKLAEVTQQLLADCQQQSDLHCELTALHDGLEFYLQRYRRLSDIRLVYLPAQHEVPAANPWPRYSADYVLLRAYVGRDNKPAQYGADNQPYRASHVRLSAQGAKEHELILSPGFATGSRRHSSVDEVRFHFEQLYPRALDYLQQGERLIGELIVPGSKQAQQYSTTVARFAQQGAKIGAMLQHYQRSSLLSDKQVREQAMLGWINSSPLRQQLYGPVLNNLQRLMQKRQAMQQRDLVLSYLQYAQLPGFALQLYQYVLQPDAAQQGKLEQALQRLDQQYDSRIDMELALHYLGQYAQLPPKLRLPALDQYFALSDGFNREIVRHKLAAMYRGTSLTDAKARRIWLARAPQAFSQSSDPMISFAVAMQPTAQQLAAERARITTELTTARAAMMEVHIAFNDAQGQPSYAETNGQLRFSLGHVTGYQPTDAVWYQPFSSLGGMLRQLELTKPAMSLAATNTTATMPVNFLSSADSCSAYGAAPTLNSSGELVGVMYAGLQENLLADWHYDNRHSRAVHIDSRFIIWQLQQSKAGQLLLQELLP